MTHGQLITRLCKMRDDLADTVVQLKDEPVEWVKEKPEGCEYCAERAVIATDKDGDPIQIIQGSDGKYDLVGCEWNILIDYCPFCDRDLR